MRSISRRKARERTKKSVIFVEKRVCASAERPELLVKLYER